jgi:thioredoxin-like negative regulator of GroEL
LLAGRYGRDKLRQMLQLWGEGKSTAEVLHSALGITGQELDRQFDAYLEQRLQRYGAQFMATALSVDAAQLQIQLEHSPRDRQLRLQKALLLLEVNKPSEAERVLAALVREDAQDAQASFALARTLLLTGEPGAAHERLQSLLAQGHDGYEIQLLLARSQQAQGEDFAGALQAAHEADPTQEEALFGLWQLARQAGDSAGELRWLRELAPLARHSPDVYRRYLELLLRPAHSPVVRAGSTAVWALGRGTDGVRQCPVVSRFRRRSGAGPPGLCRGARPARPTRAS